jgi:hypothetical protein
MTGGREKGDAHASPVSSGSLAWAPLLLPSSSSLSRVAVAVDREAGAESREREGICRPSGCFGGGDSLMVAVLLHACQ